jgi:hypothetical protein
MRSESSALTERDVLLFDFLPEGLSDDEEPCRFRVRFEGELLGRIRTEVTKEPTIAVSAKGVDKRLDRYHGLRF